jgi:hypothetical protein
VDLSHFTDEALSRLLANCIFEVMTGGPRAAAAESRLEAAYPEIEKRLSGHDETGLLAALGYHVGHREPMPEERRRAVLGYIFRSPLPNIRRNSYIERWGEPSTDQRCGRIAAMLRWFIDRHVGDPAMSRACAEWRTDLRFVLDGDLNDNHGVIAAAHGLPNPPRKHERPA